MRLARLGARLDDRRRVPPAAAASLAELKDDLALAHHPELASRDALDRGGVVAQLAHFGPQALALAIAVGVLGGHVVELFLEPAEARQPGRLEHEHRNRNEGEAEHRDRERSLDEVAPREGRRSFARCSRPAPLTRCGSNRCSSAAKRRTCVTSLPWPPSWTDCLPGSGTACW